MRPTLRRWPWRGSYERILHATAEESQYASFHVEELHANCAHLRDQIAALERADYFGNRSQARAKSPRAWRGRDGVRCCVCAAREQG
jgi:hypothetical protein